MKLAPVKIATNHADLIGAIYIE